MGETYINKDLTFTKCIIKFNKGKQRKNHLYTPRTVQQRSKFRANENKNDCQAFYLTTVNQLNGDALI